MTVDWIDTAQWIGLSVLAWSLWWHLGRPSHSPEPLVYHVLPVGDLVGHEESGTDCVCMPDVSREPVMGTIVVHHALDGREADE
jgi:hypothetical protein